MNTTRRSTASWWIVFLMMTAPLLAYLPGAATATDVSGPISGTVTWTQTNSPYIVTATVSVNFGSTLIIEPGVEVRFNSNTHLYVYGTLLAEGTAAATIKFTSNNANPTAGNWGQVRFFTDNGNPTSFIRNATVEYGTYSLYAHRASPTYDNITVTDSLYFVYSNFGASVFKSFTVGGSGHHNIDVRNGNYVFENLKTTNARYWGLVVRTSAVSVTDAEIASNSNGFYFSSSHLTGNNIHIHNNSGTGLRPISSSADVSNINVQNNYYGVYSTNAPVTGYARVEIAASTIHNNVYGFLNYYGARTQVTDSTVTGDNSASNAYGAFIAHDSSAAFIRTNFTTTGSYVARSQNTADLILVDCWGASAGSWDLLVYHDARAILVDANGGTVNFPDSRIAGHNTRTITRGGFLTAHVINSTGAPVAGAIVTVYDVLDDELDTNTTVSSGDSRVIFYQQSGTDFTGGGGYATVNTSHNAHSFVAFGQSEGVSLIGYNNSTSVTYDDVVEIQLSQPFSLWAETTITTTESYNGDTILLQGNLTIEDTGVLTLEDCFFRVDQLPGGGSPAIRVREGGRLVIRNCTLDSVSQQYSWTVGNDTNWDNPEASLLLDNATVRGLNGNGIEIDHTDDVVIHNSHFEQGSNTAVSATWSNITVTDTIFESFSIAVRLTNSWASVSDSTFRNNGAYGVYVVGGAPGINGSTFDNNNVGIYTNSRTASPVMITDNYFTNAFRGLYLYRSNVEVRDSNFTGNNRGVFNYYNRDTEPFFHNCSFYNNNIALRNYYLSHVKIDNSTFGNNNYGLYSDHTTVFAQLNNVSIHNGTYGVRARDRSEITVTNSAIRDNSASDWYLEANSWIISIDSYWDLDQTFFESEAQVFSVGHQLDVTVTDGGNPLADSRVKVYDGWDNLVSTGLSNATGVAERMFWIEYDVTQSSNFTRPDYWFLAVGWPGGNPKLGINASVPVSDLNNGALTKQVALTDAMEEWSNININVPTPRSNAAILVNGDVDVYTSGHLIMDNTVMVFNSSTPGDVDFTVHDGGQFTVSNSLMLALYENIDFKVGTQASTALTASMTMENSRLFDLTSNGVYLYYTKDVNINNSKIKAGDNYGIYSEYSRLNLTNSSIENFITGIYLFDDYQNTKGYVHNNTFQNNSYMGIRSFRNGYDFVDNEIYYTVGYTSWWSYGIYIQEGQGTELGRNTIGRFTRTGIYVRDSDDFVAHNNTIFNSATSTSYGLYLYSTSGTVRDNDLHDLYYGLYWDQMDTEPVRIINNQVNISTTSATHWGHGIWVERLYGGDAQISDNTVYSRGYGALIYTSDPYMENNTFTSWGVSNQRGYYGVQTSGSAPTMVDTTFDNLLYGMRIYYESAPVLRNATFTTIRDYGIYCYSDNVVELHNISITDPAYGIYCQFDNDLLIANSTIASIETGAGTNSGVYSRDGPSLRIRNSTITSAGEYGVYLTDNVQSVEFDNATIEGQIYGLEIASSRNSNEIYLNESVINGSTYGVYFDGVGTVNLRNTSADGGLGQGLWAYAADVNINGGTWKGDEALYAYTGSIVMVSNATLAGVTHDITVQSNSVVDIAQSTFNDGKLSVVDSSSRITHSNFLHVHVNVSVQALPTDLPQPNTEVVIEDTTLSAGQRIYATPFFGSNDATTDQGGDITYIRVPYRTWKDPGLTMQSHAPNLTLAAHYQAEWANLTTIDMSTSHWVYLLLERNAPYINGDLPDFEVEEDAVPCTMDLTLNETDNQDAFPGGDLVWSLENVNSSLLTITISDNNLTFTPVANAWGRLGAWDCIVRPGSFQVR